MFFSGLAAGALIGASLAFLFAPKKGSEIRGQLSASAGKFRRQATESLRDASDKVGEMVDKGQEAYRRGRTTPASETGGAAKPSMVGAGVGHGDNFITS